MSRVQAATNSTINFQARILTSTGALVPDGNYHVEFKIYDSASSGASAQGVCSGNSSTDDCWWLETRTTGNLVTVKNGYVTANLGSVTSFPANMPWDQELWLSMNIGGNGGGASWDGEMSPRMKITAVPFAQAANKLQNTSSGITSKLTLANPTAGDQNFVIQDQGAAGTFNLCIQNSTACGFALLGSANTFTGVNTFNAAGVALQVTNNATVGGTLGVTGLTTATGGLTVGTGANFINQGSTLFTALAISDVAGGGNIGTAAATVDAYTVFNVAQTTAGQTLTLPSPTNTTAGRMAFVNNTGSSSFTMYGSVIAANKSNAFIWNGTAWVTTVSLSGSVVNTIGTLDSVTKSADGASIAANAIYLQTADATYPGLVSTGTQTFAGNKTFSGTLTVNNYATFQNAVDSTTALQVLDADGGTPILNIDTDNERVGIGTATPGNKLSVNNLTTADSLAQVAISTGATTNKGLVIQGVASQTADLMQVQDSTGAVIFGVSASGATNVGSGANSTNNGVLHVEGTGGGATIAVGDNGNIYSNSSQFQFKSSTGRPTYFLNSATTDVVVNIRPIASQTADLLNIRDSSNVVLSGFNASGNLFYSNSTYTNVLQSATLTANRTITLPNEDGTVCTTGSVCTGYAPSATNGYVQLAPASAQTDATTNSSIYINKTGASGNILQLQKAGVDVMTLSNTGALTLQNSADSTAALSVKNLAGTSLFSVDTTNGATVLQGTQDTPTLGSELVTSQDFSDATYWTCQTGWTTTTTTAQHNTGNTNTCAATNSNFTVTAGTRYEISYTISGRTAGSIYPTMGGKTGQSIDANGTYTFGPTTTSTAQLSFTVTSTFDGTISAISVKTSTGTSKPQLAINNQAGTTVGELRVTSNVTAFGLNSLQYNTTGTKNSAFGNSSLQNNTTGYNNTASGYQSLYSNTIGFNNTASGYQSLYSNTTGFNNTALGLQSLYNNTTGVNNTALGYNSLVTNTTGIRNTAVGYTSLFSNNGSNNTAIGRDSLYFNSSGYQNTASGDGSLRNNTVGYNNTASGFNAGYQSSQTQFQTLNNLQGSTMLGAYSQAYANNVLALGGQGTDSVKVGIGTGLPTNQLSAEAYRYSTGTVTTNGTTTVTGSGTTFTSDMVGNVIYIATNSTSTAPYMRTITSYTSDTEITVDSAVPALTNAQYYINYVGLQVTASGNVGIGTTNPTGLLQVGSTNDGYIKVRSSVAYGSGELEGYYISESNPRYGIGRDVLGSALPGIFFKSTAGGATATHGVAVGSPALNTLGLYTSNGTALTERLRIDINGNVGIGSAASSPTNTLTVNSLTTAENLAQVAISTGATTNKGLVIQGVASQTANMFEVQNSTGGIIASITSSGSIRSSSFGSLSNGVSILSTNADTGGLAVFTQGDANKGLVVRGSSSQTADLFQLQDSNGLVNASFNSAGNQLTLGRIAGSGTVTQGKLLFSDGTTDNFGLTMQSATLTDNRTITLPNETGTVCTTASGGACSALSFYIQNQNAGQQATSNFWISGTGRADTSFTTPLLDTPTAVALNIGTTNASAITIGKNSQATAFQGSVNLNGAGMSTLTTPLGGSILGRLVIQSISYDSYDSALVIGITNPSMANARGITVVDARTTTNNQPSIAVTSPDEAGIFGLSWEGLNTTGYLKASSGYDLGIKSGTTTIATFKSTGNVGINNTSAPNRLSVNALTTADSLAQIAISTGATTNKGLVIQGVASQTANLLEIQESTGSAATLFRVNKDGLAATRYLSVGNNANGIGTDAVVEVLADGTYGGLIMRSAATQTGDLVQFQSSGSVAISGFNGAGNLYYANSTYTNVLQSATLTDNRTITLPNETGTVCTTASGGACSALSFYIQNQNAGQQATSNFWISGTGRADTSFTTPLLDTPTAVALNIGTTNATQINLNQNTVIAADKNLTVDTSTLYVDGTNDRVQIGSTAAINAKLAVVGTADQTQLLVRANATQSVSSPLVLLQDSGGNELLRFTALNNSNVTIGYAAGSAASGTSSVFIGNNAGNATTGSWNTAVGSNALRLNSTGTSNTAFGAGALYATTGSSNTGLGDDAGADNTGGASNVFVGGGSGRYTRTGNYNTIVGYQAGYGVSTNSYANNTLLGYRSGYALTTGSNNILLGYQAGDNITSGANNIIIGYDINATSATGSNQLNIGNTIYGDTSLGSVLLKNTTNGASAFEVQNSAGGKLLQIDTTNNNIYLNGLNSGQPQAGTNNANSLTNGRTGVSAGQAYYNGFVYMLGGNNGGGVQTTVEYAKVNTDGSIGTVATTTALPVATTRGSVVIYNGFIYYIGGETVIDTTSVGTVYFAKLNANGTVGTWRTTTSLGTTRASVGVFTADGYMYVLGGRTGGSSYLTTAESAKIYADGTLGSWSAVTSLPNARAFGRATYANGYVYYVAGETTGFSYTSTVYHAPVNTDGTLGSWTTSGNSIPTAQISGALGTANGYLYWWGGYDGSARSNIYFAQLNADGTIGSWTTATNSLATATGSNGYALINGYLYTFGGFGNLTTIQYSPLPRVRLSGSLDLVGGVAGNLNQSGAGGSITAGDITAVGKLQVQGSASFAQNVAVDGVFTANDKARFGQLTTDDNLAQVAITTNTATSKGLVIQGAAAQTADLFQAQASTGTNLFVVSSAGSVGVKTGAIAPTGDLSFGVGANRTINVLTQTAANTAGNNLTVNAATGNGNGAGGNLVLQAGTGGATGVGGTTTLQGGSAGGGNTNGGNVYITGGVPAGSGSKGLVVIDTATYSTAATQSSAVDVNITQANIDAYGAIILNATASGVDFTLSSPTLGAAAAGRLVYITAANGSSDFTLRANVGGGVGVEQNIAMRQNTTATMIWNGTQWTAAGASSSTTLQAAYDNTLSSAGGAEIVLNNTSTSNGLTVRNNDSSPIIGGIFEAQTSIGSNLFSVNNNATEFATNGGAETAGATSTTFPANTWDTTTGGTVSRYVTAGDNIATGAASVSVVTTTTNHGARNRISTSLTSGLTYSVSFAVRGATNFSTLQVLYSPDGTTTGTTQCATAQTVTSGIWSRISCTFVASGTITSSNSILIRQTDATGRTFYIDNLSLNINASATYAADGSVDNAGAFTTNWTDFDGGTGSTTITRDTSVIYDTSASAAGTTTANANQGIRNNMAITPQTNTQYLVSFYARSTNTVTNSLSVGFLPAGGTSVPSGTAACVDYNTQSLVANTWTKITCLFTTAATAITNPDLVIYQTDATARTIYVDALSITLNTNNSNNVQIGGANRGGPATLFTLDRASSAPIAANNDAYLGSMYYDTTTGRIQCYEADGWGACGSAPDNIVNLNPEYAGAVLNGTGVGTMTADLCADQSGVLQVNASLCDGTGSPAVKATNFYKWTSPQATQQTYSIYVSYQLPTTFKAFASDDTVQLTARVDSTTNAAVTYEMFRSESGTLYSCGTETAVTTTANTWQTVGINGNESTGCGFTSSSGGAYVIFKINVKANSNANAYVSTLSFTTTGK